MRFLIVTTSREAMPVEMVMPAMHGMQAWLEEHRAAGRLVEAWSFAGMPGGGGIAEVSSHEELDQMMAGFPFAQTSYMSIYPLADLDSSLEHNINAFTAMMEAAGAGG